MKRVALLVVLGIALTASPAFAADRDDPPVAVPLTVKVDFSAKAAGLDQIIRDQKRIVIARASLSAPRIAPQGATQKKPFWKTPWPYLICGGVVAAILIARGKDGGY